MTVKPNATYDVLIEYAHAAVRARDFCGPRF
jgi:hypothetical protein